MEASRLGVEARAGEQPPRVDLLVAHASELLTCRADPGGARGAAFQALEVLRDGALAVRDGRIVAVGPSAELERRYRADWALDAGGRLVTPGFVDVHSHLLHGGSRHQEWGLSLAGQPPPAGLAGGIRYTVERTRAASDEELLLRAQRDLDVMLAHGTTTLEAKTGYGLLPEHELRLLRLTATLRHAVDVVPTYLAAHVLPAEYASRPTAYETLVAASLEAARPSAEYCDLSCDPICFGEAACRRLGERARDLGFRLRFHGDQTGPARAAQLAADLGAASVDHLDYVDDEGIAALAASDTTAVLVPGVTLHLRELSPRVRNGHLEPPAKPFLPLAFRRLVESGARVALSTDYNPGSCPMPSMQLAMQLGARLFGLSYAEAWLMSTINAAHALDRAHDRGSLEVGKRADVLLWNVPEHGMVVHRCGVNLVHTVIKDGRVVVQGATCDGRRPDRGS